MGQRSWLTAIRAVPRPTPLIRVALGLILGVWLYHGPIPPGAMAIGGLVSVIVVGCWRRRLPDPLQASVLAILLSVLTGMGWSAVHDRSAWSLWPEIDRGQLVKVRGEIVSSVQKPAPEQDSVWDAIPTGAQQTIQLGDYSIWRSGRWQPVPGRMICYLEDRSVRKQPGQPARLKNVAVGQRVQVEGKFYWPRPVRNPGQFDTGQWLLDSGTTGQLNLRQPEDVTVLESEPSWRSVGNRIKDYYRRLLRRKIPASRTDMATAILLGDRSLLSIDDKQKFAATGTIHILAISGLHLGILASALVAGGIRLGGPPRGVLAAVVVVVISYAWLVEFRPPIVRAAVLTSVFCIAGIIRRRCFTFNSLAAAILVLFVMQPCQLLNPGTHLSFLAVAAMVCVYRLKRQQEADVLQTLEDQQLSAGRRLGQRIRHAVGEAYFYCSVVFLVCLPLVIHHFHLAAWIGIVINPLVIPPMSLALVSGFGVLLFADWFPWASQQCGNVCGGALELIFQIVDLAHQIPGSHSYLPSPGWLWIWIWYLGLCLTLWLMGNRWGLGRILVGFCICFVLVYQLPSPAYPDRDGRKPQTTLTFVDVGHGNCTIIRNPAGQVLVCDAGSFPSGRSAFRKISSVLWSHGVSRIDQLVISHADLDHYNAIPQLLQRFPVNQVAIPEDFFDSEERAVAELRRVLIRSRIPMVTLKAGDQPFWKDYGVQILSPPGNIDWKDDNARSLVLQLNYGGQRVLLTGDVQDQGIEHLLSQPSQSHLLLQVPHHGSRHNRPVDMARWARPRIAVISALESRIHHDVVQKMRDRQVSVLIPNCDGAIRLNLYHDGDYTIDCWDSSPWWIR